MSWNYASEAHRSHARARRKAPVLARASFVHRGLYAFTHRTRAGAFQVWDPEYAHWLGPYSGEALTRVEMDRIAEARDRLAALRGS